MLISFYLGHLLLISGQAWRSFLGWLLWKMDTLSGVIGQVEFSVKRCGVGSSTCYDTSDTGGRWCSNGTCKTVTLRSFVRLARVHRNKQGKNPQRPESMRSVSQRRRRHVVTEMCPDRIQQPGRWMPTTNTLERYERIRRIPLLLLELELVRLTQTLSFRVRGVPRFRSSVV